MTRNKIILLVFILTLAFEGKAQEKPIVKEQLQYYDYISLLSSLDEWNDDHENVLKVEFGEKMTHNHIIPLDCPYTDPKTKKEYKECRYPIISLKNLAKPEFEFYTLPQILIIAGIEGREKVGSSAIMNFLRLFSKHKADFKLIQNHYELVILPMANPYGYYHNTATERDFDPDTDFPIFRKDRQCFQTSSARFINSVFKDRLIAMTLLFNGKEAKDMETIEIGIYII